MTRAPRATNVAGRMRMMRGGLGLAGLLIGFAAFAEEPTTNPRVLSLGPLITTNAPAVPTVPTAATNTTATTAAATNAPIIITREPSGLPGELGLSGKELKRAQEEFDRGVQMLRNKNAAAAADAFRKALAANPYQSDSHANLAVALVQLGQNAKQPAEQLRQYQTAAEHFSRASELKPKEKMTYLLWAETLVLIGDLPLDGNLRLGCYQGALEKSRKAIAVAPQHWEAYSRSAGILSVKLADFAVNDAVRLNLFTEAAALYSNAAERAAFKSDLAQSYANWGSALVQVARLSGGREDKEAFLRQALDKFDRSTRAMSKTARIWALWGSATLELAKLTHSRSDYRNGVDRLNNSLTRNPDDPDTLYNLAGGYARMGSRILAIESLRKCFELDNTGVYAARAAQDPVFADLRNETAFKELMGSHYKFGIPAYNPPLKDAPR